MAAAAPPRVVHALPGRVRIHLPSWGGADEASLEARVRRMQGVRRVRANARTKNLLVEYEDDRVDAAALVRRLGRAAGPSGPWRGGGAGHQEAGQRHTPHPDRPRGGMLVTSSSGGRARIAVRGLERDPQKARDLVERLCALPGVVRVVPSPLTGRVLVELAEGVRDLQAVLDEISDIEGPGELDHEVPTHPLDPAPIIEGAARVIGASLGLGVLIVRRARGRTRAPVRGRGPGEVAGTLSLLEGVPAVAHRLEDLLGHERKELLFAGVGVLSQTSAGSILGLIFAGAGGLRVLTEALARRAAWREYERRLGEWPPIYPGVVITLETGRRSPLAGVVLEGFGIGQNREGAPQPLEPGAPVEAGMRIHGGPLTVRLEGDGVAGAPARPPRRGARGLADRYVEVIPIVALGAGVGVALGTRSLGRALTALAIMNPRPALAGAEFADRSAAARVLRAGVTVAGSRPDRPIRRPDVLVLDGPRTLCDGWELRDAVATGPEWDTAAMTALAGAIAVAAGSPWGTALAGQGPTVPVDGAFDGQAASADAGAERWTVAPAGRGEADDLEREPGDDVLVLRRVRDGARVGVLALRPRLAGGTADLITACRDARVRLELLSGSGTEAVRRLAERAGVALVTGAAEDRVAAMEAEGLVVAVLGDSPASAAAFESADLAIGLSSGLSGPFEARADLLAPRLEAVAGIVVAGVRRDAAVRDAAAISMAANVAGAAWAIRTRPAFRDASAPVLAGGLAAMLAAELRLGGGRRERTVLERLVDPLPERWGRDDVRTVLRRLRSTPAGLSQDEAETRWTPRVEQAHRRVLLDALVRQVASPLVLFLAGGAALSLSAGAGGDALMIGAVVVANAVVGAWQERQAGAAAQALQQIAVRSARVVRQGREEDVPAGRLVPGDVLVLAPGDRVPADARVLESRGLEVDEAALTGESVPVRKSSDNGSDASRVVLEGTDVTTGTGRAVVVAVGSGTRMGAIAVALGENGGGPTPMDERLGRIMWRALPLIALSGVMTTVSGIAFGRPALEQLALGASVAIAAVPEGLPLLAGVAEAGVARRLARRRALVTRLASVEALGRVDVACVDKTGTLTTGRLGLRCVADAEGRAATPPDLPEDLRDVLRVAAAASPAPGDAAAGAHPTDVAVVEAAGAAGVGAVGRTGVETPFDPVRGFHAAVAGGRLCVKGATEVLVPRCTRARIKGEDRPLDDAGREALLERAAVLAADGLRVLFVAEGDADTPTEDPAALTALGYLGISDPLRPTSRDAVARCREAGVRVLMLTGDHPATARAVARDVGLPADDEDMVTGPELATLDGASIRERLEGATVIARSTPLDKLRIVEALRLGGHVVAMTGDGVNDAPALRLADVGVAMGGHGTEVARHAADLVLADDDFATLAEALVEGRGFWRNMRQAIGLLLGGNAGEVGTVVATGLVGLGAPLTTRQVLTVNLVTDVLPAMTVAMKPPEHRDLGKLAREGGAALDGPLRAEIVRRGIATAGPSLAACVAAGAQGGRASVGPVAFTSVVGTQLTQTLGLGWADGRPDPAIVAAVAGSLGAIAVCAALPGPRAFLGLGGLSPFGALLALGASLAAPALARAVPVDRLAG